MYRDTSNNNAIINLLVCKINSKSLEYSHMDLSIIIVSWRVKDLLKDCLNSIYNKTENLDYEVFVVDNDSKDGTEEMIKQQFPKVNLIVNENNIGFAKANNQAIKISKGDYILLLNPDTKLVDNSIKKAYESMRINNQIGIIGCRMYNPDNTNQPSVRKFPTFFAMFLIMLKLHHLILNTKTMNDYLEKDFDYEKSQEVDQVMGAFFMINRKVIDSIGLLDQHYFIWFEEVDYCRRVKNSGFKIIYLSDCKIIHHYGQSFKQVLNVRKQEIFNRSLLYYFKKHHPFYQYLGLLLIYPFSLILAFFSQIFTFKKQ